MRGTFRPFGLFAALLLGACASAPRSSETSGAQPASVVAQGAPTDSAAPRKKGCAPVHESLLVQGPVYAPCEVDAPVRLVGRPGPMDLPNTRSSCMQALIELVIDERGAPVLDLTRIVRTNNTQYALATIRSFQGATYAPAKKNGVPVRSVFAAEQIAGAAVVSSRSGSPPPMSAPSRPPRC